jgi:hypothetical protein
LKLIFRSRKAIMRLEKVMIREGQRIIIPDEIASHFVARNDGLIDPNYANQEVDVYGFGDWEGTKYRIPATDIMVVTGLSVSVYRNAEIADCTNGGVTSRVTQCLLTGGKISGSVPETETCPALKIVSRDLSRFGKGSEYLHAEPYDTGGSWTMFGGNFVASSDSRVTNACPPNGIIPVHDRVE